MKRKATRQQSSSSSTAGAATATTSSNDADRIEHASKSKKHQFLSVNMRKELQQLQNRPTLELTLHEWFTRTALHADVLDKVAVVSPSQSMRLTFAELHSQTQLLATYLKHCKGVRAADPQHETVAILMPRSVQFAVAYIGILKAGGAYLPLDSMMPADPIAEILSDANPVMTLTVKQLEHLLPSDHPRLLMEDDGQWMATVEGKLEKLSTQQLVDRDRLILDDAPSLDNLAYVVYSGGTTGKPKGIACPHRGAVYSYEYRHRFFPFEEHDRVACNVFFVWEFLRPLLCGYPMYIIPDDVIYDPPALIRFLKEHSITRVLFTPSLLDSVLRLRTAEVFECLKNMKIVWLCGEVVTADLRSKFLSIFKEIRLLNLYSISECHDVSIADLNAKQPTSSTCSCGHLLEQVRVAVLDPDTLEPQPVATAGELFVGGPHLARGYLNRPEENRKRFIPRPAALPVEFGEVVYRTGDWGLLSVDNELELTGRCDSMQKIRGYSIHLPVVEAAIAEMKDIVESVVVRVVGAEGTDKHLVAYLVLKVARSQVSRRMFRVALAKKLAIYMIPTNFLILEQLPLNTYSAKLNAKELPAIGSEAELLDRDGVPNTQLESDIADLYKSILQVDFVDVRESFFDLGGHSLLVMELLRSLKDRYPSSLSTLSMKSFLESSSVRALATLCGQTPTTTTTSSSVGTNGTSGSSSSVGTSGNGRVDAVVTPIESSAIPLSLHAEVASETVVPDAFAVRSFWRHLHWHSMANKHSHSSVLVTGGTGFLGSFLIRELLLHSNFTVYALVRHSQHQSLEDRAKEVWQQYELWTDVEPHLHTRVLLVEGDITLPSLGMSAEEIEILFHTAASVNLVYPYAALRGTNVMGTRNVLQFCTHGRLKSLHYASTNSIFPHGSTGDDSHMYKEDDAVPAPASTQGGYAESKWVADQLVLKARENGLPVCVYRMGNLAGPLNVGVWNKADFNLLLLKHILSEGTAPLSSKWTLEWQPVTLLTKFMVDCSLSTNHFGKVFHCVQSHPLTMEQVHRELCALGYNIRSFPFTQWKAELATRESTSELVEIVNGPEGNALEHYPILDTKNYTSAAAEYDAIPPDPTMLFRLYISLLAKNQLLPSTEQLVLSPTVPPRVNKRSAGFQVAVVTGASSGIGAAVAKKLACEDGYIVCLLARSADKLDAIELEIGKQRGYARCFPVDITSAEAVKKIMTVIHEQLGQIDVLVCCAGCMYYTEVQDLEVDLWKQQVDVNINGVLNSVAAVVPVMKDLHRGGHIVVISSDAGRKPFPGLAVYSGTKFFIEGFCGAMRQELVSENIKVTTVQPGDVLTPLQNMSTNKSAAEKYGNSDYDNMLDASSVAEAICWAVRQPAKCSINEILIEPKKYPI